MVNRFLIFIFIASVAQSDEASDLVRQNCLDCHKRQKIPSELIYRRYLLKFSTNDKIKEHLISYLKDPKVENSIMPKQFFLKFPQKKALDLNDSVLEESIEEYLNYFDIKKRLKINN